MYKKRKTASKSALDDAALRRALVKSGKENQQAADRRHFQKVLQAHEAAYRGELMQYERNQNPQRPLAEVLDVVNPLVNAEVERYCRAQAPRGFRVNQMATSGPSTVVRALAPGQSSPTPLGRISDADAEDSDSSDSTAI